VPYPLCFFFAKQSCERAGLWSRLHATRWDVALAGVQMPTAASDTVCKFAQLEPEGNGTDELLHAARREVCESIVCGGRAA
jgi:hypothetical protein